jgi:hypothetical protein
MSTRALLPTVSLATYSLREHVLHAATEVWSCCPSNVNGFCGVACLVQCICIFECCRLLQSWGMLKDVKSVLVAIQVQQCYRLDMMCLGVRLGLLYRGIGSFEDFLVVV